MKKVMTVKEITVGLPIEFEDLLKYSRTMGFTDRPDYSFIKKMFDAVLFRAQYPDYLFDWKILHVTDIYLDNVYVYVEKRKGHGPAASRKGIHEDRDK